MAKGTMKKGGGTAPTKKAGNSFRTSKTKPAQIDKKNIGRVV